MKATGGSSALDVREVAQRARQGDQAAVSVFTHAFRALGTALALAITAFQPSILVVGGFIAGSWDLFTVFFAADFPPPAFFAACARLIASRCALPGCFFGCCPRAAFAAFRQAGKRAGSGGSAA